MLRRGVSILSSSGLSRDCTRSLAQRVDYQSFGEVPVNNKYKEIVDIDEKMTPEKAQRNADKLAEKIRNSNADLLETKKRIRRWRNRGISLTESNEDNGINDDFPQERNDRLSDADWQKAINEEEEEWDERAEELIRILEETSSFNKKDMQLEKRKSPALTRREEFMKRKTGQSTFRKIIYSEGELDKTDLNKPPSIDNPHPFDPSTLPPVHSRSIVPYINHVPLLQILVDLGVNLFEIDCSTNLAKHLLKLDVETVRPKIQWLVSIGVEPSDLGTYLTRNPFFLIQNLDDMKARVNYLKMKKFTTENIAKIVKEFRYWLNVDVKTMDARLGWIQKQFSLSGDQVRKVVCMEPRIVMFGLGPLQRLVNVLTKELDVTPHELKRMLLDDPRLFIMDAKFVTTNFRYVRYVMGLSKKTVCKNPFILRCSLSSIRSRHEFLKKLGRANYEGMAKHEEIPSEESEENEQTEKDDENIETLVKIEDFLHPQDVVFANKAAKTYLVAYDKYLRNN